MPAATVTSKGQITIPIEVRQALGLHAGDRVDFVEGANGVFEIRPANQSIRVLRGSLAQYAPSSPLSAEAMDEATAGAVAGANR